jgi:hypothetical protein
MRRVGVVIASISLLGAVTASARANKFHPQDANALEALVQRITLAKGDNNTVLKPIISQHDFETVSCLEAINQALDSCYSYVTTILTLIRISSSMETSVDEVTVNGYLADELTYALKLLPLDRQGVNNNVGYCGRSAVIATRAQVALSILEDGERILLWLSRRR